MIMKCNCGSIICLSHNYQKCPGSTIFDPENLLCVPPNEASGSCLGKSLLTREQTNSYFIITIVTRFLAPSSSTELTTTATKSTTMVTTEFTTTSPETSTSSTTSTTRATRPTTACPTCPWVNYLVNIIDAIDH